MNPIKHAWTAVATLLLALAAVALVACGNDQAPVTSAAPAAATQAGQAQAQATTAAATATTAAGPAATAVVTATPEVHYTGKFALSPEKGAIGSDVKATGTGLPADADMTVYWTDATGQWKLDTTQGSYLGREFTTKLVPLTKVHTDASGNFITSFTVPDGFGFEHDVVVQQGDTVVNKALYTVKMQVSITPTSGPAGTPITINIAGMGYQYLENSWQVLYDNNYNGWMSSVTEHGHATAQITANGVPGTHVIQLLHGWSHVPYLNNQQSPIPDRQYMFTMDFTITDGANVLPPAPETQALPPVKAVVPADNGQPQIWTDLASGPVETPITISGRNLPAGEVNLRWASVTGNRVVNGYAENTTDLATAQASADGTLTYQLKTPDDLGGVHRIDAVVNGKVVASTSYTMQPSALPVENGSGPVGTVAMFHLMGVGWTETANIYTMVYDNDYMGFACGFNSQGNVQIYLPITGAPGWHYVDLYPAIYKGTDIRGANNFRIPQLTITDHPNEKLPAFHFAVFVTGGSSQ